MKKSFLFLLLLFMLIPLGCDDSGSSGGTPKRPKPPEPNVIYIADAAELKAMASDTEGYGKHYILTADIDLAGNASNPWVPVGNPAKPFTGTFDGAGFKISGIYINQPTKDYQGFFGHLSSAAVVKNLGVSVDITGKDYVGGIAGYNEGEISGVYVGGDVAANDKAGGIAGYNGGTISGSYSTGDVTANNDYAGGISGWNYGTISDCAALNSSVAGSGAGRIVGYNDSGNLSNNYAFDGMKVNNVTVTGAIGDNNGKDVSEGIRAGEINNPDFWNGCGWLNFDTNIWDLDFGARKYRLPWLKGMGNQPSVLPVHMNLVRFITDETELRAIAGNTAGYDKHYVLMNDIVLTGDDWSPIGNNTNQFRGVFDGNGHTVKDVVINAPTVGSRGFFGFLSSSALVKDLGLLDVDITGNDFVGGIAGYNVGTISGSYSVGDVTATSMIAGGVAGWNEGTISGSYSTATVDAASSAGGVAGVNFGAILGSYSTGDVAANNSAGGIAGSNNIIGTISSSYSTGAVTAVNDNAGGVAGYNVGTISGSYSTGAVTATNNYAGGIAGMGSVSSSYPSTILDCVALNNSVTITNSNPDVARIFYNDFDDTLENNYAYEGILVGIVGSEALVGSGDAEAVHDGRHGANAAKGTASGQINNPDFWNGTGTVGFLTDIWDLNFSGRDYKLPLLKNIPLAKQPDTLPDHLKLQP